METPGETPNGGERTGSMTGEGDLVLVYMDNKPAFFARIELIETDVKPDWFQVKMLVLQLPLVVITWILRSVYIDGEEFTMGGRPVRLEKVVAPEDEKALETTEAPLEESKEPAASSHPAEKSKVISMKDRRKKDQSS
jgi:hypothetical protein